MKFLDEASKKWLDDHLDAFVDGSLSPSEEQRFKSLSVGIDEIENQMELSGLISKSLRSIPDETCPDFVAQNVMAHVRRDIRRSTWMRIESFFLSIRLSQLKPVLAVAALVFIVISSTQVGRSPAQSEAEVSQALNDVKWTLAYLSGVGKSTGTTVKASVIEEQMVQPMSRSFNVLSEN